MSIQDKTGCPYLDFVDAGDVLACCSRGGRGPGGGGGGVQYCTCILDEGMYHGPVGELLDFG